ncbi:hypothetical protein [Actinoplanes siamensis]|uniref:hypothetical protein n=1 Tax=Actinoplanes siamensis TaxID=1223317 RepID=UPI0019428AB7|nr:hypothetical protein [Actinoplanes siamensis]
MITVLIVVTGVHLGRRPERSRGRRRSALNRPEDTQPGSEPFEEDLELVIQIGTGPGSDRVAEHRVTRRRHAHAIGYRKLTLISAYLSPHAEETPVVPALTVHDPEVKADWLPLAIPNRGAVIFMPPVFAPELSWELVYPVPNGIWNPLREVGLDVFRYDLRKFPMQRFVVRFVLHPEAKAFSVHERNHLGTLSYGWDSNGNRIALWCAGEPAARTRYEWEIRAVWQ